MRKLIKGERARAKGRIIRVLDVWLLKLCDHAAEAVVHSNLLP